MGLASSARYNSAVTNMSYHLRAAVAVNKLDTGYYEVVGECGHRLTVIHGVRVKDWEERIAEGRKHRKRCTRCPKEQS